ncbi:MAG: putative metallohydrolase [Methanocella sp. PtaU1.Bin125]|nr:MAG: putative metallohydrolase [Methanocella sp. PtaU1.Bin125]
MIPKPVLSHINDSQARYLADLIEFLRIPSISMYSSYAGDVRKAAQWALDRAQRLGFTGALYETPGHPVVYAELCPHKDAPTLLIYGHYDVQPAEPLEKWLTPPFEPAVRDGAVYARGATDDKGQLFTYFMAIESILSAEGELPLNVKLFLEGEEELGSPNMDAFCTAHREMLKADYVAVSDGSKFEKHLPAIEYGLRGLVYMQLDVQGPACDIHSGVYGGAVANPAQALVAIIRTMRDDKGHVLIPGFYDRVRAIEPWEREQLAALPLNEESIKTLLGVDRFVPEEGFTFLESTWARPTCEINGIWGGFQGEGSKTIIPASAGAKVSMRLVPDQDPLEIMRLFEEHVRKVTPPGVTVTITAHAHSGPVIVSRQSDAILAAEKSLTYAYGRKPVFVRSGGSIGVVVTMKEQLGIEEVLLIGWGNPEDGEHSPNEHFSLDDFYRGTLAVAALMYELGERKAP